MMRNRPGIAGASIVGLALCGLGIAVRAGMPGQQGNAGPGPAKFVGANTCGSCHQSKRDEWVSGRHSKMVQLATKASVRGDFSQSTITLRGSRYGLRVARGEFFITEPYLTGRAQQHRVQYTLGNRRVQHYLTTLPDGRIIILPPSWDVQRRTWFHNLEIVRPDESTRTPVQTWNRGCVGCHVSEQRVNYNPATRSYATVWNDFGTSCERCHGPGSIHVEQYRTNRDGAAADRFIVRPTRLDPNGSSMICAQCHSLRGVIAPDFTAGADYYDYFQPVLEYQSHHGGDPSYWADGRPRRFSNDAIGLWQSECFLRGGATCTSCHLNPHVPDVDRNPQLAPANNHLCTGCHQDIGTRLTAHTRHPASSAGSACVECHMPNTVVGVKATMRDHTISLPAPENTVAFGIPNACTECHTDKPAAWAAGVAKTWWPEGRRQKLIERAEAFTAAQGRRPEAFERLIAIAADSGQGPLVQANALGYLRYYADVRATAALIAAARADHPAIRSVALSSLQPAPEAIRLDGPARSSENQPAPADERRVQAALFDALDAPRLAVRLSALGVLIRMDDRDLSSVDDQRLQRVSREFAAMARLYEDDANVQSALGLVRLRTRQFDLAAVALSNSLGLEPRLSATKFLLALARIGQRRYDDARRLLNEVPPSDPMYRPAQERLQHIDSVVR